MNCRINSCRRHCVVLLLSLTAFSLAGCDDDDAPDPNTSAVVNATPVANVTRAAGRFTPDVAHRVTEYKQFTFQPGDRVTISAGGCVDTGAAPFLRKYVNPEGPGSERLFSGRIWVPGVTPGLVRIGGWIGTYTIPANVPHPSQLYLRLGYEAEDYPALKIRQQGDTKPGQCQGAAGGPAYVEISVQSDPAAAAAPPAPTFNLAWDQLDANFFPWHPRWTFWNAPPNPPKDPSAADACANFPAKKDGTVTISGGCTTQQPFIDHPAKKSFNDLVCHIGGVKGSLRGHVNWGLATYQGKISWSDWTFDGDFNMTLLPDPNISQHTILSTGNKDTAGIDLEFAADETADYFATKTWHGFYDAVNEALGKENQYDGSQAIVTGLLGLDNEHGAHAELHPLIALAMRVNPAREDETWLMFGRNWGNEGFCSQDVHYFDLPNGRYTFRLPWVGGDQLQAPEATFLSHSDVNGSSHDYTPQVSGSRQAGYVEVTFALDPPESRQFVEGELHLHWPPAPGGVSTPTVEEIPPKPKPAAEPEGKPEGEEAMEEIFKGLTRDQQRQIQQQMKQKKHPAGPGPESVPKATDTKKSLDDARVQTVCDLAKTNSGSYPGACKQAGIK